MPGLEKQAVAVQLTNAELEKLVQLAHGKLQRYLQFLNHIVLDKPKQINLAVCCVLANGHVLFEDLPGLGKTTFAQALALLSGLKFQRVQFTSDLLPSDILGSTVFHPDTASFEFRAGAIFTQVLLADEINRSSPKTQSALLEAMEEGVVSVDGEAHALPKPFWVIATQNPAEQSGTYPLPESQLDRFLMCLSLGFPSKQAERALLEGEDRRQLLKKVPAVLDPQTILNLQQLSKQIIVSTTILDYLQALAQWTRTRAKGLSTRALLALKSAAQAHALLSGRYYVIHEDVQAVFAAVVMHRTALKPAEIELALQQVSI